jgi:hypothetical protein
LESGNKKEMKNKRVLTGDLQLLMLELS